MKKRKIVFSKSLAIVAMGAFMVIVSCSSSDNGTTTPPPAAALTLTSLQANGIDLDGASVAEGISIDAPIIATFSESVDAATAIAGNFAIEGVTADVSASGSTVTITPTADLVKGTTHNLSISSAVKSAAGGAYAGLAVSFKTDGRAPVTPPNADKMLAYWTFDGHANDEQDSFNATTETSITYIEDRFGFASSTASFDGDASIIEVPNADGLMAGPDFTVSFWVKSNSSDVNEDGETRGQFVMGMAAWFGFQFEISQNYGNCKLATHYDIGDGTTAPEDTWWSTEGNLGWQGWTFDDDVTQSGGLAAIMKDQWAHVVCSYDATAKVGTMYINGKLRKSWDFNLWPDDAPKKGTVGVKYGGNAAPGNTLAFGFIQGSENRIVVDDWANPGFGPDNNHFKGELDDVRIFNAAYTAEDVTTLYTAEQ